MLKRIRSIIQSRYIVRMLIYFVIIGLVPICIFSFSTLKIAMANARDELRHQTENAAQFVSSELDEWLAEYSSLLDTLSHDSVITEYVKGTRISYHNEALHRLYAVMSARTRYVDAHVVSAVYNRGISTDTVPVNYLPPYNGDWGIFRMANGIGGAVFRTHDNNPNVKNDVAFSLAHAIRNEDGSVTGYVVFDVFNGMLYDLLTRAQKDYRMTFYMADRFGFLFYDGDNLTGSALKRLPDSLSGVETLAAVELDRGDSGTCFVSRAAVPRFGLSVYASIPVSYAEQTGQYVRSAAIIACLISLALCLIFSLIAWRDVSKPIHSLSGAIQKVEHGDLTARVDMRNRQDELGRLGESFNRMAEETEQLLKNVEEKQQRLRIAESSALQAQINPHFLYNTLDLIKWNAKLNHTEEVARMTVLLGKLLRAMANFDRDIVTVAEEIALIRSYLEIQRIHYGDRLETDIQIPQALEELRIPKLILQPVVENAVVHGMKSQKPTCRISILARATGNTIQFIIEDDGAGIPPEVLEQLLDTSGDYGSIGLRNVHRRAQLHGGERCGLSIESTLGVGTRVTITLRRMNAEDEL